MGITLILTNHDRSAFGVHSQELPGDNASAATLAKSLLVDLLKHVFGGMVLQDDDPTTVTAHYNVV